MADQERARTPGKPKLPATVEPAGFEDLRPDEEFHRRGFEALDGRERSLVGIDFEECRFRRTDLASAELERVTFVDCEITAGDWANVQADTRTRMRRVSLSQARLMGIRWSGELRDVSVSECRIDLSTFRFATLKNVSFEECKLVRADFTEADIRGAQFHNCDLTEAQFHHCQADDARFTDCDLAGVRGVTSLQGAVISSADLASLSHTLASALGIKLA